MTRIEVGRHVAADPVSVALLLAEPPLEDEPDRRIVVMTPHRTGVGFTAAVEVMESPGHVLAGEVTVEPASDAGCEVRIVFGVTDRRAARVVERAGAAYLAILAARARSRATAA